jgi:sugar lactone lactonase YvrE
MRKVLAVFIILLIIIGSAAFILFRWKRKPVPTLVAWRAHVTTIAGDGSPRVVESKDPRQAAFSDPFGIAISKDGTIYVSDGGDSDRIRKISAEGILTTLVGNGVFNTPSGLAIDAGGNLYVADTGNNRIRKVATDGSVTTIAGDGTAGYVDGPAAQARFNGPVGVAVDAQGNILVADTYNDRIRKISTDGQVSTVAGAGRPGFADGDRATSLFDTPCGIVVDSQGSLIVADTGNDRIRKITPDGNVYSFNVTVNGQNISSPIGLALTHDNYLYVTELDRARVIQIAPDASAYVIAGRGPGFEDGSADEARFNQPAGIAINERTGALYVADGSNYLVRKLDPKPPATTAASTLTGPVPRISNETLGQQSLIWPLDPQNQPHEVVATVGEVRGAFNSTDSRDHLHSGLDVFGAYGSVVRAVRSEKVTSPLPNWGFDTLNEGFRIGVISYIHQLVGRGTDERMFADPRFIPVNDTNGRVTRVRIKRGTRFRPGDALGSVNRMYHTHLIVGPSGGEINPLELSPIGFKDDVPPSIEKNGIQLFDESGKQFSEKQKGRLLVTGKVHIVVDAFDRTNLNAERRRLGLFMLGYQILKSDDTPAPDFAEPRITQIYDRLPPDRDSTKIAYADHSGITVYGSESTRFLYEVTNWVRDGRANRDAWDTAKLPPGDYVLRIIARDYNGNEAKQDRDVLITIR